MISPTRVRFKLRPGVRFHDGTPFNAAAVKFTLDRALKGTPPGRWASLAGPLAGAEVVDDLTVDVVTSEPFGPILRSLALVYAGIVSPTAVVKAGPDFSRAPVGTGPFKFVEWKTNTHVILERFADYWGDKAPLDRVVFRVLPEEGARMIALQTGDADMVLFPSPVQLAALRRDPKFAVHEATGLRVVFVGMHAKQPPLDDVRVRSALLHAVDLKAILANILEGAALPARGVLAPGVFGFKDMRLDQLYPFDRGRAKALLAQAGWNPGPDGVMQKGGQRLTLTWLAARGRYPKDGEITEAVQAMLRDVGVEAKVEWREWASAFTQFRGDPLSFHLFTLGWVTSSTDADSSLYPLFHSRQLPPGGWNTSRYANARVDTLVEQARRSLNQGERERLYGEAQDLLAKEMVWIPIYNTMEIVATRASVKGFGVHPVEYFLPLGKVWLDR
ncbi:MAG: hypothetical protein AUH09_09020 [Candidatus Rokubacteria bacterium 13_2_20CM_70_12]|nr:MAG: hypothetical protein AUH09_09020 [Candidatus Rokubacteria bacterium 13_2_20CM_70_12]